MPQYWSRIVVKPARIIYCHCAYSQVVPADVKQEVPRRLAESETAFDAVADLCEMSARRDPGLKALAAEGDVKIAACFPRAVRGLFIAADAPLPEQGVQICNMRTDTAEQVDFGIADRRRPADRKLMGEKTGEKAGEMVLEEKK